jgi:hypothetical protein
MPIPPVSNARFARFWRTSVCPTDVGAFLIERGYVVYRICNLIVNVGTKSTPDEVVARISDSLGGIWATNNAKDFQAKKGLTIPTGRCRRRA